MDDEQTPSSSGWSPEKRVGRYQLLERLGQGGMGEVWLATQTGAEGFSKRVALKRIATARSNDPEFVQMFVDEARLAAHLSHPYVVQVFDFGEHAGAHYLAMELLEGSSLEELLARSRARRVLPPIGVAARLISQAAEALHYAHTRSDPSGQPLHIIHRDVSPQNLFVTSDGKLKVLDFGIARATVRVHETVVGQIRGHVRYMAPEQLRGERIDARVDQFALGAVLFELLSGNPLRDSARLQDVALTSTDEVVTARELRRARPEVPQALAGIVAKALAPVKQGRFESCAALGAALEDALSSANMRVGSAEVVAWAEGLASKPAGASSTVRDTAVTELATGSAGTAAPRPTRSTPPAPRTGTERVAPARRRGAPVLRLVAAGIIFLVAGVVGAMFWTSRASAPADPAPPPLTGTTAQVARDGMPAAGSDALSAGRAAGADTQVPAIVVAEPAAKNEPPTTPATEPEPPVAQRPRESTNAQRRSGPVRTATPRRGTGLITLDSAPWSNVYLDGRKLGVTPVIELALPSGRHTFLFVSGDKKLQRELTVTLRAGDRIARKVELAKGESR